MKTKDTSSIRVEVKKEKKKNKRSINGRKIRSNKSFACAKCEYSKDNTEVPSEENKNKNSKRKGK